MSTDHRALAPYGKTPEQSRLDRAAEAGKTAADTSFESVLSAQPPAALAQPEPVAPTDEEIEEWADASTEVPLEEMDPDIHGWRRCFTKEEFGASIRAALARWGTPVNTINQEDYDRD